MNTPTTKPWLTLSLLAALASSATGLAQTSSGTHARASQQAGSFQLDSKSVSRAAAKIDALVEAALTDAGEKPEPSIDDATFVRRTYLRIVGRIPNLDETRAFLDSKKQDKRERLIDELLLSPGRASHDFHYWADLLRAKTRLVPQVSGAPYLEWIQESVAANTPYDDFVKALISAEGAAYAESNGPTGYYLRDRGMPEDNMANTVRIFLGTRIECAQCHDHPFDKWKQKQFFEMAAFTGGIEFRQNLRQSENADSLRAVARDVRTKYGAEGQRALQRILRTVVAGVHGSGTGVALLPRDYQYPDAKPGQLVTAQTLFGDPVEIDVQIPRERQTRRRQRELTDRQMRALERRRMSQVKEVGSRHKFAEWLTSPTNPRFTKVIANRMWKRAMGIGLIEPVDDIKDDTVASIPAVMEELERLMVELDYDLREFQRVLANTETFQRACPPRDPVAGEPWLFTGPTFQRMSAEQIWDSMLTFVLRDADSTLGRDDAAPVRDRYETFFAMTAEEIEEQVETQMLRGTDPEEYRRRIAAARAQQRQARMSEQRQLRRDAGPLLRDLARARRKGDMKREDEIMQQLEQKGLLDAVRLANRNLVRASELSSPAPDGHFLREFGQSDRDQIEGSFDDPSVPQALTLLNGLIEREVLRRDSSVLLSVIRSAKRPAEQIENAFLSILNREPTSAERSLWQRDFRADADAACKDLVWTLVNSHEFRFIR